MKCGVPQMYESPCGDCLAVCRRPFLRAGGAASRVGLLLLGSLFMLIFASTALGASASSGRHDPTRAADETPCVDMPTCSGCSGRGGGGGESKTTPVVTKTTPVVTEAAPVVTEAAPVVTEASAGVTETASGAVSAADAVVVPAIPAKIAISVRPPVRLAPKGTLKKPKRAVTTKRAVKKHHARAHGGTSEQTFARPVLPGKRAAFTG
jgi:hypothetical protein